MAGLLFPASAKQEKPAMDHSHMPIELPEHALKIALSISVERDSMSGYNLTIHTQNYHFSPPPVDMTMMDMMSADIDPLTHSAIGHAHLYVNGDKIQRVYGKFVHLPANLFKDGINSISISLNNHGHMYWTIDDKQVIATLFINEQLEKFQTHKFESFPIASSSIH